MTEDERDERRRRVIDFLYAGRWYYGAAIVLLVLHACINEPDPVTAKEMIWVGIGWLVFCAGTAWVLHGFGFLLVKMDK